MGGATTPTPLQEKDAQTEVGYIDFVGSGRLLLIAPFHGPLEGNRALFRKKTYGGDIQSEFLIRDSHRFMFRIFLLKVKE